MTLKKDKQKVLGEVFDDARLKTFLDHQPYGSQNPDFHVLEKAYRGMHAENFATFIQFFLDAGRDLNATNESGQTLLDIVRSHRLGEEYAEILVQAGAK